MGNPVNIKIEPMNVVFGEDTPQVQTIKCPAVGSNGNKYLVISSPTVNYYAWFNVNDLGVDPAPAGLTEIEVAVATAATAAQMATALQAALDAHAAFSAAVSVDTVTVTNVANGYARPVHHGNASGFTFEVTTLGDEEADAGYIEGDVEFNGIGEDLEAVTAHQSGSTIITHLRKGNPKLEVAFTFKETSLAQIRRIFMPSTSIYQPDGASATELIGIGTEKQFTSTFSQAKKLRLHPVRLDDTDLSEDWNFWKAYLSLESIKFSGEKAFSIPVKFMIYPDEDMPTAVRYMAIGDGSQLEE